MSAKEDGKHATPTAAATTATTTTGGSGGNAAVTASGAVGIHINDGKTTTAATGGASASSGTATGAQPSTAGPPSTEALIVAAGGSLGKPKKGAGDGGDSKVTVTKNAEGKHVVTFSEPPSAEAKLDSRGWTAMTDADKKLNACCGADPRAARDGYEKAGGQFKLDEEWEEAAAAFIKAAEVCETITDKEGLEAGRFYESAAKCMRNSSAREALKILEWARFFYEEKVSTNSCAKVWETIGDIHEHDLKEYAQAMDAYEKAADNLFAQDLMAKANAMFLRVATLAASRYDFKRAIAIYERVAKKCLEPSGKYVSEAHQVVRHLYHAGLCQLVMAARAGDIAPASAAVNGYRAMAPQFDRSDEYKFVSELVRAFEENNAQLFTDTCYKYDKTHPLDQWSSTLLLECKQILKGVKAGNLASIQLDLGRLGDPSASGAAAEPNLQ